MKLPKDYVPGLGVVKPTGGFGGFGQRMLEKQGWAEGQGLGKGKHGIKDAIDVKKKEDTLGVGAKQSSWQWDWKYWEDAYNSAAKTIKSHAGSDSSSDSDSDSDTSSSSSSDSGSSSSSDSDSSDDEQVAFASIAAAASASMNRDGTTCTASEAELKLAAQLAKDPWGRFGGKDGKLARIKRQEEAQAAAARAKLGLPTQTASGAEAGSSKKRKGEGEVPAGDAGKGGSSSSSSKKQKQDPAGDPQQPEQQQPAKPRKVVVVQLAVDRAQLAAAAAFQPTPATGWWGAAMFQSAGLLEGLDEEAQQEAQQRKEFNEDTQEALYMKTHETQRQGRRGLGKSSTLKIAGGAWAGKKVQFAEEEEEEQGGQAQQQAEEAGEQKRSKKKQKQKKQEQQEEEVEADTKASKATPSSSGGASGAAGGSSGGGSKPKWVKLAVAQLSAAPERQLKWKKLWPLLWAAAQQQQAAVGGLGEADSCKAAALEKLQQSKKVVVAGKLVSLP